MEFIVEKVALEQVFVQTLWLSPENYIPRLLLIIHMASVAGQTLLV
jgi:hypothetical protein